MVEERESSFKSNICFTGGLLKWKCDVGCAVHCRLGPCKYIECLYIRSKIVVVEI